MLKIRCQEQLDGTVQGVILFRPKRNSILMNEISMNTLNEELDQQAILGENSVQKKYTQLSTTWRSRVQSEEIVTT